MLLSEDPRKLSECTEALATVPSFTRCVFISSKCKMPLQICVGSNANNVLVGEVLREVCMFRYIGSYISPGGRMSDDLSSRLRKT